MNRKIVVVIGAGAAGCLTAKVLAEHFNSVVVIDRDSPPSIDVLRKSVPQGRHVHNVLFHGNQIIEEMFPGFFDESFDTAESPLIEMAKDQKLLGPCGWMPRYASGRVMRGYSRAFLDGRLFSHLQEIKNIEFRFQEQVSGLEIDRTENKVVAVKIVNVQSGASTTIQADLVVDCSGRSTKLYSWLSEAGYSQPACKRLANGDGYATAVLQIQGASPAWSQFAILRAPPVRARGAYLLRVERNRWYLTLVGGDGDYPPADLPGFLAYAQSLESPLPMKLIERSEFLGKIHVHRRMDSFCHFVDRVEDWPSGIIALGDAVCAFNPVFGQGITSAALSAKLLSKMLNGKTKLDWEKKFHRKLVDLFEGPWLYSNREELREANDKFAWIYARMLTRYRIWANRWILKAATVNKFAHRRLFLAQNMYIPARSLYRLWFVFFAVFASRSLAKSRSKENFGEETWLTSPSIDRRKAEAEKEARVG